MSDYSGYINAGVGLGSWISGMVMGRRDRLERQRQFNINAWLSAQQFAYERDLQERIFGREDNAVQRRVADLKAAGLNPSLAAGSSANAGSVVPVHAPQVGHAGREAEMRVMASTLELMKMWSDIGISRQEERRLRNQNEFDEETLDARVSSVRSDANYKEKTFDDRVAAIALSNDTTKINNEVAEQRKRLYSAEVDKVEVDTALQNVELEFKRALDAAGIRLREIQERLLSLELTNDIKNHDLELFNAIGITSNAPQGKLIPFATHLTTVVTESLKRIFPSKAHLFDKPLVRNRRREES